MYLISRIKYQILCCWYSLELSRLDNSNEYPQHGVWKRINGFRMASLPVVWSSVVYSHYPLPNNFDNTWEDGLCKHGQTIKMVVNSIVSLSHNVCYPFKAKSHYTLKPQLVSRCLQMLSLTGLQFCSLLTLSQTTQFRLFQTERVCR